jgi:uncharacterized protein (TIGR02246 family)
MSEQTATELERETQRFLELMDAMDLRGLAAMFTDDGQGVDELSRNWRRGRAALDAYFAELEGTVTDVRSQLSDLQATAWGDAALVTFVLNQTYKMNAQEQSISAPTSMVFRREDGGWKLAMVHSVPVPDQTSS